ncbi:hypothetical protein [Gandjariella thermophila]|uniref:Uncharacterized protein n=1 Tax=Gandjariella thermophila TaxID=1931992 RepID=A0A4D4JJB2_9PSEU|nr:hypothetical protein [Gandjariella thermophila]GDY33993.1 hypothetical protein GTS_56260 [Gandjariella thermophila]
MLYKLIRIYEVPADSLVEATDHFREALELHVEKDFLVHDRWKPPGQSSASTKRPAPRAGMPWWLRVLRQQLLG